MKDLLILHIEKYIYNKLNFTFVFLCTNTSDVFIKTCLIISEWRFFNISMTNIDTEIDIILYLNSFTSVHILWQSFYSSWALSYLYCGSTLGLKLYKSFEASESPTQVTSLRIGEYHCILKQRDMFFFSSWFPAANRHFNLSSFQIKTIPKCISKL